MAVLTSANYLFLPWVRQGAAAGIQTVDMTPDQAGVVSVTAKLRINDTPDLEHQVRLYGPGDVTGIDSHQVIRTEPRNLATDFEPNYFPSIEFDRPDFPWLFTPAKADAGGRLRPWLCLIIIRKQEGVELRVDRNLPLAVLEIKEPALPERELPDLSESWAWAHVQLTGSSSDSASLKNSLAGDPALTLSRLLCPRRLDPLTEYYACVVPTFELGVKAGLGLPIQRDSVHDDEKELKPAWTIGTGNLSELKLPVYFQWEFRTGAGGDFEALVGLLKARDARDMPRVGKRLIDISRPGFTITPLLDEGTTLDLEGALRVLNITADEWPESTRENFQTELKKILDAPWEAMNQENKEPLLAPPIYGCWQAARHTVNITPEPPAALTWLDDLNLDPRHRTVAAVGTRVVQTEQEQLMAAAWEQLGEIQRINQLKRQAQLGRTVNGVYHTRHFTNFSEELLLKILAPAQSRVVVEATINVAPRALLSQRIAESPVPDRAVSGPMRRFTSPRGTISTRFRTVGVPQQPITIMTRLNIPATLLLPRRLAGLNTLDQVSDNLQGVPVVVQLNQSVRFERVSNAILTAPQLGNFTVVAEGVVPRRTLLDFAPAPTDSPDAAMFRKLVTAHQDHLGRLFAPSTTAVSPVNLFESDLKSKLLRSINPETTIQARVQASLVFAAGAVEPVGDSLEPILDAPEFPQPMYEALRDLSQDFLLPGLENVPLNTVALLETNSEFVESFLVGLNTEMSSELLWRNYPTDQRGTYFRQFWDTSAGSAQFDIDAISKWGEHRLGKNSPNATGKLVLLIRGELLRRYPNTVIYAVAAVRKTRLDLSRDPNDERHPLFRGTLNPDVTFLGFDLNRDDAIADPGWFFVIQQQPTEPRFGMDVADFEKPVPPLPLTTWNDLSWRHLANTENELKALSYASIKTVLPDIENEKAKWGINSNSAHHAYITLQRPVRIAIHASQMIKSV
jgi:hypothetical protein